MEEVVLLTLMATFTLVAGLCSIVFNRLKLPPLIGYLVAGIIIANVWTMTSDWEFVVSTLSSIGLVMLMFSIGLEIDLSKVRTQGVFAIKVAVIQLPLIVIGGMVFGPVLGFNMVQSIALGAIISGSSTAVVLAVLRSQAKLDSDHIDLLILITIMEDIGQVIILSMITPILAGSSMNIDSLVVMIISIIVFMTVSLIVGLKIVPLVINWVSDNVSTEVLVIFSVGLAFGMALLSVKVGLSMAIGAFLMGMMLSPCKPNKEINHQIEPMKNLFMAMFFISVGMEIKVGVIAENVGLIFAIYALFAVLKLSTVFLGYWICNSDGRTGFISAVSLVAMGEFAFIIAKEAYGYNVVSQSFYTSVIGAALLSMIVLPFLTRYADRIWDTGVKKCPKSLDRLFGAICRFRDGVYSAIDASSRKSQETFKKGMTHAYFNILLIAFIQIAFYWLIPPASDWLFKSFGGTLLAWQITLVVTNLMVLIPATAHLVENTKFLSIIVVSGAEQISRRRNKADGESKTAYSSFLEINTYLFTFAIDFLLVFIVPNPLGVIEHFICLGIALLLLYLIYRRTRRNSGVKSVGDVITSTDVDTTLTSVDGTQVADDGSETEDEAEDISDDGGETKVPDDDDR